MTIQIVLSILMVLVNIIIYFIFGSLVMAGNKERPLRATLSVLVGFLIYYCIFDIPCLWVMMRWRPLSVLSMTWAVVMAVIAVVSALLSHRKWLSLAKNIGSYLGENKIFCLIAFLIVAVQIVLIVNAYVFTLDAAYYVANVTTSLQTNTMNIYNPYTGDWQNHFETRYLFATYTMNDAVWCQLTGIHPLIWVKTIMAATAVILTNIVYYRIGRKLFGNSNPKILLMLFFCGVLNFFYTSTFTSSNFMTTRTYEGKSLVGNVILPLIIYIFICLYEDCKAGKVWLLLFLTCVASTILSSSSNMLVPATVGVFALPLAIRRKSIGVVLKSILCVIPCIVLLLMYILYVKGLFVFYTYPPLFGKH